MKEYLTLLIGWSSLFVIFMPIAWGYKKLYKQKFSFKEYFWFMCGYMIFAAVMNRL